jgi:hypothetical protein
MNQKREFPLTQEPVDLILSIHMRNLFATYGEDQVRTALKELFDISMLSKEELEAILEGAV